MVLSVRENGMLHKAFIQKPTANSHIMIIYSVTVSIVEEIASEWQEWMLGHHIPEVIATGCFVGYVFHKQLDPPAEAGYITYNTRYECESLEILATYQKEFAPALQKDFANRYEGKFKAFRNVFQTF